MSYLSLIQFENWNEHDVGNWLKGLDDAIHPYIPDFIEEEVDGKKLLMLTHSDLDRLGVTKLGHQELILEGIDLLMSLRYMFETENLQHLALQLGCKARSLHNEIIARNGENDQNRANVAQINRNYRQVPISVLSAICDIMNTLKILTSWLDRSPFDSIYDISLLRNSIVKLGLELVTDAQRESPITEVENAIVKSCQDMTEYCDKLVLNMKESLVVQPAYLEIAVIRKKQDDELGMHIQSSYCGIHVIGTIKDRSPADLCSKVEKGDEVLLVNNQTVLGWQLVKLVAALKEKPKEVTMLLKKRPRHANPFGIIANRRQLGNRHHVPAVATLPKTLKKRRSREGDKPPRPTLQEYVTSSIPTGDIYITKESPEDNNDENDNDTDNDVFRSGSESPQFTLPVMVDAKQRRATVSGGSPTFERPLLVVEDLGTVPARPKSQAINQAEREAAIAALLAADNTLQRRLSKKKTPEGSKDESQEKAIKQENRKDSESVDDKKSTETLKDNRATESTVDNKVTDLVQDNKAAEPVSDNRVETDKASDSSTVAVEGTEREAEVKQDSNLSADQASQDTNKDEEEKAVIKEEINMEQDDNMTQGFIVKKPTPLMSDSVATNITSRARRQKIVSSEVAGNAIKGEVPQLMRIRRLNSRETDKMEDDDVFVKPQKKVGFSDDIPESEKEESYTHIVIGNVVQKIPIDKAAPYAKPTTVQMRTKKANSKTRLNRRISCKDLGKGDCEGWLYKRRQGTLSKNWVKRWCVLKMHDFFYFKAKEDIKAEGVIHLPAFQVSPAPSLKTKKFEHGAFKIHNPGTSFYFASERQDDMGKWMNKMGLAAISYTRGRGSSEPDGTSPPDKASVSSSISTRSADFSESEDEGDDGANAISGSVQSLTSVSSLGSAHSPQNSPVIRRHHLAHAKASVGASTEALNAMLQSIQSSDLTIDGKDRTAQRKSRCTAVANMDCPPDDQEELDKLRKLDSLHRTLKAKEQEVEEIDRLMNSSMTPNDLNQFLDEHQNVVASSNSQEKL